LRKVLVKDRRIPPGIEFQAPGKRLSYGYVIVACTFIILLVMFGTNYSFGVFFNRLLNDFGWSRAVTSTGYSIAQFLGGVMGIITGKLGDRFGPRIIVLVCAILMAVGCILMAFISQPWQLYIFYGVLVGFGVGGAAIPLSANISRWFVKRRGLMTGIVVAGIGTGTILMPLLINLLVERYDWRHTFVILGILVLAVVIPLSFLLKNNVQCTQKPSGGRKLSETSKLPQSLGGFSFRQAVRTRQFWIAGVVYIFAGFYIQSVMVHIVPFARELGIDAARAAVIMSFLGIGSIIGRIVMGSLSDKLGVRYTLAISLGLILLTFFWLQAAGSLWMLYIFAVFYGFGYGSMIAMLTLAPARLFGLSSLGTLVGVLTCIYTLGGGVGPVLSGYIYDISGSYRQAFVIFIALAAAGLVFSLFLKQPVKKERG
jgi:MFS transporter, OFA family, oxalate/formate antiporter